MSVARSKRQPGAVGADGPAGAAELAYDEITDNGVISGSSGSPTTIITGSSFTADGGPVLVEFNCPLLSKGTEVCIIELYLDGSLLARMAQVEANPSSPVGVSFRHSPSAGSHQYTIKGWINGGTNATVNAGGPGETFLPSFLRVSSC